MNKLSVRHIGFIVLLGAFTHTVCAQWIKSNPAAGRVIHALTVCDSNILAAGGGGSWRSQDYGNTWTLNSLIMDSRALTTSGKNIFIGGIGTNSGVFLSTDYGINWVAVNNGLTNKVITTLLSIDSNLFAGTTGGVFLSTNNAMTWKLDGSGLPPAAYNVQVFAVSDSNIFAGTYLQGVYRCSLGNTNWHSFNTGLTSKNVSALTVVGNNVFAGTSGGGIFRSAINDSIWTTINTGLTDMYIFSLIVIGNQIFAGTGDNGVFISTDNGANWVPFNTGLTTASIYSLAVCGNNIFAGTDSAVWRRPLSEIGVINHSPLKGLRQQGNLKIQSHKRNSSKVNIVFSLLQANQTNLSIYNLSGHQIASIIDMYLESGSYNLIWDTRNITDGFYTIWLRAGANSYVKSLPLFR